MALKARELVEALKAAAEPTRLRILLLLKSGELNVKDLTHILGQSQPRISRHLKLLGEAGLVDRFREGSWVYFHLSDRTEGGQLASELLRSVDPRDLVLRRDRERLDVLKRERETAAQTYFQIHAADWDRIRALHVAESDVEGAMRRVLGPGPFKLLVDLGTGTGRVLELMADRFVRGLGFDVNNEMLHYARSNMARARLDHAQVRHGDIYSLAQTDGAADAVVMHQVLHFLSEPAVAVAEAAGILAPGGRLLVVDFAPHDLEFLRDAHAHERLGFAPALIQNWMVEAGLRPVGVEHLTPPDTGGHKLTVTLWTAQKGHAMAHGAERRRKELEETP